MEPRPHLVALRRVSLREGGYHLVDQPAHHHAEPAIESPFQIEVDAADEGIGHFAVGENPNLGFGFGVDGVRRRFGALQIAAHDRGGEICDDVGIALVPAETCKDEPGDVFQKQVLHDGIDRDLAQPLHGARRKLELAKTISDDLFDLLRIFALHRRAEIRRKAGKIGARRTVLAKLIVAPHPLDGRFENGIVALALAIGIIAHELRQMENVSEDRSQKPTVFVALLGPRKKLFEIIQHRAEADRVITHMGEGLGANFLLVMFDQVFPGMSHHVGDAEEHHADGAALDQIE